MLDLCLFSELRRKKRTNGKKLVENFRVPREFKFKAIDFTQLMINQTARFMRLDE